VRDPALNQSIALPVAERQTLVGGLTREQLMRDPFHRRSLQGYLFQTGQPVEIRNAFLAAMGVNETDISGPEVALDPLAPSPR